jgi:transposase InsO family protein
MFGVFLAVLRSLAAAFQPRRQLLLENLALRHQLLVLSRNARKPKFSNSDRLLWICLRAVWSRWERALVILRPQTVIGWHRAGFRLFWRWKSRCRDGRPSADRELIQLIHRMWQANPTWGSPRIRDELAKSGLQVSDSTIRKYRPRRPRSSSQSWKTFLHNHTQQIVAIDFFTVPTAAFRVLFVFIVLAHERRTVLHFAITESPSACWTGQQLVNAFPFEAAPRFLLRDRDGIYGAEFGRRAASLGMEEKVIAPRSPWQNPHAERLIGTLRRECLDQVIILNERHLNRVLRVYVDYYHRHRTHRALDSDCPVPRSVQKADQGKIVEFSLVGGLHHRYTRQAA